MSITNSALLVETNISVWTASKRDKDATTDLLNSNNASADSGHVYKNLMAGSLLRKKISDYAAGCRLWHNMKTQPWSDKGPRLLASSYVLDYMAETASRVQTFNAMVDEFCAEYPQLVVIAAKSMGGLHNPADYPSVDEIRSKFGYKAVYTPVPEAGDFRIDVNTQALQHMKEQYEEAYNARITEAMGSAWKQLHAMLTTMSEKLIEAGPDVKRRWHDSFLTNAEDLCGMLKHFNVTGDPKLEQARRDLEATLIGVDIESLKEDVDTRADLKARLDTMLSDYSDW